MWCGEYNTVEPRWRNRYTRQVEGLCLIGVLVRLQSGAFDRTISGWPSPATACARLQCPKLASARGSVTKSLWHPLEHRRTVDDCWSPSGLAHCRVLPNWDGGSRTRVLVDRLHVLMLQQLPPQIALAGIVQVTSLSSVSHPETSDVLRVVIRGLHRLPQTRVVIHQASAVAGG